MIWGVQGWQIFKPLKLLMKSVNAPVALGLIGLSACGFDANIPNQTTFQNLQGRALTVGFEEGVQNASFGAAGIAVRDMGNRPLTEDDGAVALAAARAHCAEFTLGLDRDPELGQQPGQQRGQQPGLDQAAGVFYPAGAVWQFGRCVE